MVNVPDKPNPSSEITFYQSENGDTRIQVRLAEETVWLTQNQMGELFQTTKQNISLHIKNILFSGELKEISVVKEYLTTASDGKKYSTKYYNLEMILSVGYRVNSFRGTQFRIWATQRLKEYIVKGFVLDDERIKEGRTLAGNRYFDELLERIRDIRASERLFYQKITDIFAQCSIDYDSDSDITQQFYATVQNKLHWAIHHHTAAEIIAGRAKAEKPNMGLTTWKNAPKGKIRKSDIHIAKNYLTEEELRDLNLIVTMYLDYAELQARNRKPMYMKDWVGKLDGFLKFNEKEILTDAGTVLAEVAQQLADTEFVKYKDTQYLIESTEPVSDFDKIIQKIKRLNTKKKK